MIKESTATKHQSILKDVDVMSKETGSDGETLKYRQSYIYLTVAIKYNMRPGSVRRIWYSSEYYPL